MKADFRAKFLGHLIAKKENKGFTLIELLVVIIIIGILSAIALPSFLNQANKARASEAKSYVGSMNRAQQAYILENPTFLTDNNKFNQLGLGIPTQTKYYQYKVAADATNGGVKNTGIPTTPETSPAILKAYTGTVAIGVTAGGGVGEATSIALLCESITPVKTTHSPADAKATKTEGNISKLECVSDTQKQID